MVGDAPAGAQVQVFQSFEVRGDHLHTEVSQVGAATQLQRLQVHHIGYDLQHRLVGDLLAPGEVQLSQGGDGGGERMIQIIVANVTAAAQIQGSQIVDSSGDLLERSEHTEDLDTLDAASVQAVDVRGGHPPGQVEFRLDASPHRLMVGGISPGLANLGCATLIWHLQIGEDDS